MGVERQLPPKREVALALLQDSTVSVYLDPRAEDVYVPPWFKKQPQLMLQIGLNMPVPIPDLDIGEDALTCTLSFNRRPEFCRIPWGSVYALVGEDGRGMIWPDDVPAEVAAQAEGRSTSQRARSHLRAVPNEDARGEEAPKEEPAAPAKASTSKKKKRAATESAAAAQPGREETAQPAAATAEPAVERSAAAVKRKKKAAARTVERAAEKAAEEAQKKAQGEGAAAQDTPPVADGVAARSEAERRKGKRELPSYLRVVK